MAVLAIFPPSSELLGYCQRLPPGAMKPFPSSCRQGNAAVNADETRSSLRTSLVAFIVLLILLFGAYLLGVSQSSRGILSVLKEQDAKEHLVAAMLVNLQASSEAEKSAVMAETDEASQTYASEAQQKTVVVEEARRELSGLIEGKGPAEEEKLLSEFNAAWTAYQELDREILALAVENTNLKAVKLSLGPAADALTRFDSALQQIAAAATTNPDGAEASKAAFQAVVAAHKIHALEGPHIAESTDAEMDRIEGEMTALDKQVSAALETLSKLPGAEQQAELAQAQAAYQEFQKVQTQILELSRRNSNVRSLALSLGKKRMATASCTEALSALQKSIRSEKSSATRW